jgi:hypothetical protein
MLTPFTFTPRQWSTVELYDETQRLCDANLTVPALKIVVPDGDLELKRRNQNIGEHFFSLANAMLVCVQTKQLDVK